MKIGLFSKKDKYSVEYLEKFKKESGLDCVILPTDEQIDLIVCFGGDGTTLKCVAWAVSKNIPIISVNTGNLGFLSAYSPESLIYLYEHIKNNKVEYEEKCLIEIDLFGEKHIALNEVVIQRSLKERSEVAGFYFFIDDKLADEFLGDGIIISTPTGSTAYSLSTGAPILAPDVNAFVVNAICPHTLSARSIVFSNKNKASVEIKKCNDECFVYCDGNYIGKMDKGQEASVIKSKKTVKIAKVNDFFSRLNSKLRSW